MVFSLYSLLVAIIQEISMFSVIVFSGSVDTFNLDSAVVQQSYTLATLSGRSRRRSMRKSAREHKRPVRASDEGHQEGPGRWVSWRVTARAQCTHASCLHATLVMIFYMSFLYFIHVLLTAVCIIQGMRLFILKKKKCLMNLISPSILHGMI